MQENPAHRACLNLYKFRQKGKSLRIGQKHRFQRLRKPVNHLLTRGDKYRVFKAGNSLETVRKMFKKLGYFKR